MKTYNDLTTRDEKLNYLHGQIERAERQQGGFPYPYQSHVVPYLSSWFKQAYGKDAEWLDILKALAGSYGVDTSIVPELVKHDAKSDDWQSLIVKFDLVSNSSKILKLLDNAETLINQKLANKQISDEPSQLFHAQNVKLLTEHIDKVRQQVFHGACGDESFYKVYANLNNSPIGKLWRYFTATSSELQAVFEQLCHCIAVDNRALDNKPQ